MSEMDERDVEAPDADAFEQRLPLGEDEERSTWREEVPFDADEADAVEQDRIVELDEDDYR
ncbi:hypothetical protein [Thermomonospora catenispora]|uniref:hypothetical protein n=1 Tax=Thermomonospora catenispora TaxID=2493090 RepID=UPI001122824D|nr:hypothetical protein [Thermomonospora catenispora]TNY34600.1 hypothetical protein EIO00_22920 [Thermomonospora catenispora]